LKFIVTQMTEHLVSSDDRKLIERFEQGAILPSEFSHSMHLRIAYIYLCEGELEAAYSRMKSAILRFVSHHGVDPRKYHETLTRAWMMAVHHFMNHSPRLGSSLDFVASNPALLNSEIMLTHYSRQTLFGEPARAAFVEPDLAPIPEK